jgi:hypothetical protein
MPQDETVPCPKCKRPLAQVGEVVVNGHAYPVYQSDNDDCAVPWTVGDSVFPTAYTFIIGPDGKPHDPAAPHDPLSF